MATLQKIRNRAGLLVGALGIALLCFVLGDLFNSGGTLFNRFKDKAFVVNGKTVTTGEYSARVTQAEEFQKMNSGGNLTEEDLAGVKEQVYQQMVKEMILDDQAAKLGITVTKEELDDLVSGENISSVLMEFFGNSQTRTFDRQALDQYLNMLRTDPTTLESDDQKNQLLMMKSQWAYIQNLIKYRRLEEKYSSLFAGALLVNDVEAKASFEGTKRNVDLAYVVQRYTTIADSTVVVDDKDMKALYEQKKNNFKAPFDLRRITYFVKDVMPSSEDFAAVEKEMGTIREKLETTDNPELVVADYSAEPFMDAYVAQDKLPADVKEFVQNSAPGAVLGPLKNGELFSLYRLMDKTVATDSINVQFINLPEGTDKTFSNNFADSIVNVIKGGKDFAVVAQELSQQPGVGQPQWATEAELIAARLDKDLVKKYMDAPKGEIMKTTVRGIIQIARIDDKKAPVAKAKLAVIAVPVTVSDRTSNSIESELQQFVSANENKDSFVKAANEKGYNLMSDVLLNPTQQGLQGISGSRSVIHWAYNEKVGSVKKFDMDAADKKVVAIITEDIPAGFRPFNDADVQSYLKAEVVKNKKAEKMIADFKAKPATSLEAYAQTLGSKVDTTRYVNFNTSNIQGLGREPIVNVYAQHGKANTLTGPLKGENGVLLLNIFDTKEEDLKYDPEVTKSQLQRNYFYMARMVVGSLREAMNVEDNRVKFW